MCMLVLFGYVCLCGKELNRKKKKRVVWSELFPLSGFAQYRDCFPSGGN